jgi:hypothetical protein
MTNRLDDWPISKKEKRIFVYVWWGMDGTGGKKEVDTMAEAHEHCQNLIAVGHGKEGRSEVIIETVNIKREVFGGG